MSWLNFNDSLNNLKGQISNFASNVLADEEGPELKDIDSKKLQELCYQQELEIMRLRQINEDLNNGQTHSHDASQPNGSWNWDTNEEPPPKVPADSISDLKKQISFLENEKSELLGQLDQLDADNQENLANIMKMKEKLQFELNDVNENYVRIKKENKILIEKEKKLKKEVEKLKEKKQGDTDTENNEDYIEKCKDLAEANQKVNNELEELKQELNGIKSSNETLQKIVEDTKKAEESTGTEKLKKLESENKLLYSELKKASETITIFEKKSLEDEENCQKLAFILETYEKQVSSLKQEVEEFSRTYRDAHSKLTESERAYNDLKIEQENIKENYNKKVNALKEELDNLKTQQHTDTVDLNLVKELEATVDKYKKEIDDLRKENGETTVDLSELKELEASIENQKRELESENEELKKLNEELLIKATGRMDTDLEDELEDIQKEHEAQLNLLREELEQLKNQEAKNAADRKKFDEVEEEKLAISRELKDLREEFKEFEENHKISLHGLHNKYIGIITENIKKFQECERPSDFQHRINEDDPQVAELSKHVENIMKILLDLKCKCGDLEKRILDISEEKNIILVQKNREIEKLMQNSDMLSQEIQAKAQSIKEYENECNEIAKNNELLITELETFKNNPGLQTISESNEDNMILLESQLENANRRIDDLEKIIDDLEKSKMRKDSLEDGSDLENAVKQLDITETEITNKKKDYHELLNNFDQLQVEYESMKNELEEAKESVTFSTEENAELQANLEKLKTDYENTEYQLSELNVNCEAMKEEIEEYKNKLKLLLSENSNLKLQNEETSNKYLDFECRVNNLEKQLTAEENDKRNFESQMEAITEKLKNSKMAETSLKLQYEQRGKELAAQSEERYNLEISLNKINADLAQFQNNFMELQTENDKLLLEREALKEDALKKEEKVHQLTSLVNELEEKLKTHSLQNVDETVTKTVDEDVKKIEVVSNTSEKTVNEDYNNLKLILDQTVLEKANLKAELSRLAQVQSQLKETTEKCTALHQQLQEITNSRNELINMVTMKHQENVTYHNEIQRLNQLLTTEAETYKNLEAQFKQLQSNVSKEDMEVKNQEIEKLTDQNYFLKEKCEVMAKNLLEEQAKTQKLIAEKAVPSERETTLQKNLDRLQAHLIDLEEHYTAELFQAEQKNSALKAKVNDIEEREKSSSTMYTSVSIRANQQVESLQSQLQTVIVERDSLRKQISDAEDENTKQAAALANLQFVLEQFRKDKEKDVTQETERIRRQINVEKQVQEELRKEIVNLTAQLEERNQGLLAASRLSDQLESSKKTILGLKDEVSQLQTKLSRTADDLSNALSSTDGKVDKLLIKNLILGFVTSNNNMNRDQTQILKIIATVLDFNQQDHDKVQLKEPQQGWLASFLAPNPNNQNKMLEASLSRAFIQFLENESRPRVMPSLLDNTAPAPSNDPTTSTSTTPRQSPIVLSEIVLPTFSDFAQNRNSSSILKDVLKDNN